jgi:4-amino-4-deoxy-L-arabinose transferase-like glycosyltransferase
MKSVIQDFFHKISRSVKSHKLQTGLFVGLILLAAFLRLYNLRNTVVFLGDEGRDALVVKRILVDHKLTLLGPTASVGGFYLGPIYYYFMVPFMWLSNLDPVGPAIMVALMGIGTVAILFYLLNRWYGFFAAFLPSLIYAVSPGITQFSRSSWNPNPLPLFTVLILFCLDRYFRNHRLIWILLTGICFGIIIQLHYLALILLPVATIILLIQSPKKSWLKLCLILAIGFFLGAAPYLGFEIRHGFPNIRSVIEFIGRGGNTTGPRSWNLFWLFYDINRFNLESVLSSQFAKLTPKLTLLLFGFVLIFISWLVFHRRKISLPTRSILILWVLGSIGIGLYKGQLHYHYFEFFFPVPFLLLGLCLSRIKNLSYKLIATAIAVIFCLFLLPKSPAWAEGSRLIDQTDKVASAVINLSGGKPFNFALITPGNSDHAYRFFLERHNSPPVPIEMSITEQLIVVCEQEIDKCHPLGHPLWEIAGFGRAELIDTVKILENLYVFRLVHHIDSQNLIGKPANHG